VNINFISVKIQNKTPKETETDSLKMLKWCSGKRLLIVFTLKRYFPQTSVANVVIFSLDIAVGNWHFVCFSSQSSTFFDF